MTENKSLSGGTGGETTTTMEVVTDEATEDQLIEQASVPNLAALFKQGKDAGLIKPGKEYGNS